LVKVPRHYAAPWYTMGLGAALSLSQGGKKKGGKKGGRGEKGFWKGKGSHVMVVRGFGPPQPSLSSAIKRKKKKGGGKKGEKKERREKAPT